MDNFSIAIDGNTIKIKADDETLLNIKRKLEASLSSQAAFFEHLPYRLSTIAELDDTTVHFEDIPAFSINTFSDALKKGFVLFGNDALEALSSSL